MRRLDNKDFTDLEDESRGNDRVTARREGHHDTLPTSRSSTRRVIGIMYTLLVVLLAIYFVCVMFGADMCAIPAVRARKILAITVINDKRIQIHCRLGQYYHPHFLYKAIASAQ
jgi:hypothetical protein